MQSGALRRTQAHSRTVSCNQGAHELLDDLVLRLLIAFVEEHRESFISCNERCHRRQSVAMNGTHRRRRREFHQLVHKFGLACIVRNLGQFLEGGHLASARRGRRSACGCEGAHLRAQAHAIRHNQAQSRTVSCNQGAHELLDDLVLRLLITFVEEHRESFACQLLSAFV